MLTPTLRQSASRRRWTADAAVRSAGLNTHAASARGTLTLALSACGLIHVVDSLSRPGRWLVQALLMALLAVGLSGVARRSSEMSFGWLLSGSVAAGLAIAATYNLIQAAVTPALPATGAVIVAAVILLVVHAGRWRGRPRD
jgi:hypothetical protein